MSIFSKRSLLFFSLISLLNLLIWKGLSFGQGFGIPILKVEPTTLTFKPEQWGADPQPQILKITNAGTGTLAWSAWTSEGWLKISPMKGEADTEIEVSLNIGWDWMQPGTYQGKIHINNVSNYTNVIDPIEVTLILENPPTLKVEPTTLTFKPEQWGADPQPQILKITNAGTGTLAWSAWTSEGWLKIDPSEGEAPSEMVVLVEPGWNWRSPGIYEGSINFNVNSNGGNSQVSVEVKMELESPIEIVLKPSTLQFVSYHGKENPPAQSITIDNEKAFVFQWSASSDKDWVKIEPSSGLTPGKVNVSVDTEGLEVGLYEAEIDFEVHGFISDISKTAKVTLDVKPAPRLKVDPESSWIEVWESDDVSEISSIRVFSEEEEAVQWEAFTNVSWLKMERTEGTTPSQLDFWIIPTGLKPGRYETHIQFKNTSNPEDVVVSHKVEVVVRKDKKKPSVWLEPDRQSINYPETLMVFIKAEGLKNVSRIELIIKFDSQVLSVLDAVADLKGVQVLPGDLLNNIKKGFLSSNLVNNEEGLINFAVVMFSQTEGIEGSGNIAVCQFKSKGKGKSNIVLKTARIVSNNQVLDVELKGCDVEVLSGPQNIPLNVNFYAPNPTPGSSAYIKVDIGSPTYRVASLKEAVLELILLDSAYVNFDLPVRTCFVEGEFLRNKSEIDVLQEQPDKIILRFQKKKQENLSGFGNLFEIKSSILSDARIGELARIEVSGEGVDEFGNPIIFKPNQAELRITAIPLRIKCPEVIGVGSAFTLKVEVGDSLYPITDLKKLSFTIDAPQIFTQIQPPYKTLKGGLFGGYVDLTTSKNLGILDIFYSKEEGLGSTGFGIIEIKLKVKEDVTGVSTVTFGLKDLEIVDSRGDRIGVRIYSTTCRVGAIVWPGDTNNDGRVDIFDIFPIARFWQNRGPIRKDASLEWKGQPAVPWEELAATYSDTNGDGIIDDLDVEAIARNWQRQHNQYFENKENVAFALQTYNLVDLDMAKIFQRLYFRLCSYTHIKVPSQLMCDLKKLAFSIGVPKKSEVFTNCPNPFEKGTWIRFRLKEPSEVCIMIYNLAGELVREIRPKGKRQEGMEIGSFENKEGLAIYWDGKNNNDYEVSSGIYIYQFFIDDSLLATKTMIKK
jgi:hypothetical protein